MKRVRDSIYLKVIEEASARHLSDTQISALILRQGKLAPISADTIKHIRIRNGIKSGYADRLRIKSESRKQRAERNAARSKAYRALEPDILNAVEYGQSDLSISRQFKVSPSFVRATRRRAGILESAKANNSNQQAETTWQNLLNGQRYSEAKLRPVPLGFPRYLDHDCFLLRTGEAMT